MSKNIFEAIQNHNLIDLVNALARGDNPNTLSPEWPAWTPLHEAIEQLEDGGSLDVIVLLLRFDAFVDMWDTAHESTPLLMAIFRNQTESVRLLLVAGADTNVVSSEGDTPLRWCVENNCYNMASILLHCGATKTINSAGGLKGMTALGLAANQLNIQMIELLLQAGADPEFPDIDRLTAYERLPLRNQTQDDAVWLAAEALLLNDFHPRSSIKTII